jgi:hypothetical protein
MGIDGVTPHIYGEKEKQDLSERWVMLLLNEDG